MQAVEHGVIQVICAWIAVGAKLPPSTAAAVNSRAACQRNPTRVIYMVIAVVVVIYGALHPVVGDVVHVGGVVVAVVVVVVVVVQPLVVVAVAGGVVLHVGLPNLEGLVGGGQTHVVALYLKLFKQVKKMLL